MRKETCEIRFLVVKIPRFVLSATRVLDLGKRSESRVLSAQLLLVILRHS
jgi:hypothetical protein